MTHSSSLTESQLGRCWSSLKTALRSGTLTKSWMHTNVVTIFLITWLTYWHADAQLCCLTPNTSSTANRSYRLSSSTNNTFLSYPLHATDSLLIDDNLYCFLIVIFFFPSEGLMLLMIVTTTSWHMVIFIWIIDTQGLYKIDILFSYW